MACDVALGLGDGVFDGLERLLGRPRVVVLLDDDRARCPRR